MNAILSHWAKMWRGPALNINAGGETFIIGQGTPKTTITLSNKRVLARLVANPSLAFGEAYMSGDIHIDGTLLDLLQGFYQTFDSLKLPLPSRLKKKFGRLTMPKIPISTAIQNARHHYDVGNDFYKLWLDPTLAYTCAYYAHEGDSLETAQRQKFELVCRKARLQKNQRVIDLGCGWGGLLFHATEHYGAFATGVVAAKEQAEFIRDEAARRGLSDKVTVQLGDWREASGIYDRVLSVGMLEHVGLRQYPQFFSLVHSLLKDDGIAFIHSIGRMKVGVVSNEWISKYIFPGYFGPALEEVVRPAAVAGLHITDIENLWQHYVKTLAHWSENYSHARAQVVHMYGEEFDRMWWLYLQGSQAGFTWGGLNLWQLVMTKNKQVPWPLNREVTADQLLPNKIIT